MAREEKLSKAQELLRDSEIRKRRLILGLPKASEMRKSLAKLASEAQELLKQAEESVEDFDWEYLERLSVIKDVERLGDYVEQSTELIDALQKILTDMRDSLDKLSKMFEDEVSTNLKLEAEALKSIEAYLKRWS